MNKATRLEKYLEEHNLLERDVAFAYKKIAHEKRKKAAALKRTLKGEKVTSLFREGYSLAEIGVLFKITRERSRQIIAEHIGKAAYREQVAINRAKKKKEYQEKQEASWHRKCVKCDKPFVAKTAKYCSRDCRQQAITFREYPEWVAGRPIHQKNFNQEEWRALNRLRASWYYAANREKVKENSRRYYRNNRELHGIYQKRYNERKVFGEALTDIPAPKRPEVMKL